MIVRSKPSTLSLFFILRGSIVPAIAPRVLTMSAFAAGVVILDHLRPGLLDDVSVAPFTLLGLSLSIFLGFRNNACYDRWWEARKLWGQLIYEMRCLGRETVLLLGDEQEEVKQRQLRRLIGFTHGLTAKLRRTDEKAAIAPWVSAEECQALQSRRSLLNGLLKVIHAEYVDRLRAGTLTDILYQSLVTRLAAISGIQAGCERIQNTPLPFAYTLLLHRTAVLFCLLLPFALVSSLGWFTPMVMAVVAYAFFGLDALGDELEDPFGTAQNDLPLLAMTRVIEIDLLELLDEAALPEAIEPVNYVLH